MLAGLFLSGTACTSYRQIEPGAVESYDEVRVTTINGAKATLLGPSISTDTLRGYPGGQEIQIDVPLEQITGFKSHQTDSLKTAGLVAGIALAAAAVGVVAWASSNCIGSACGE
jgi:hypothetical protein